MDYTRCGINKLLLVFIPLSVVMVTDTVEGKCSTDQWECKDGECVPLRHRCTGLFACLDRSHNKNCVTCGANTTRCRNGDCVHKSRLCDGFINCSDFSDEQSCVTCGANIIRCRNGDCVQKSLLCDGFSHCHDYSDEQSCVTCGANTIRCRNGDCVLKSLLCNGFIGCKDSSDEESCVTCGADTTRCRNGKCVHNSFLCDGYNNCGDKSDEESCVKCRGNSFKCNNIRCIGIELRCDGQDDCQDNSDEVNCVCDQQQTSKNKTLECSKNVSSDVEFCFDSHKASYCCQTCYDKFSKHSPDLQCQHVYGKNAIFVLRGLHLDLYTNPSFICSALLCYVDNNRIKVIAAAPGTICGSGKVCLHGDCQLRLSIIEDDTYEDVHMELRQVKKTVGNGETMGSNEQGQEMKDNEVQYVYPDGSKEILTYNDEITSVLTQTHSRENYGEGASSQLKDADVTSSATPGLYRNMYHCPDVSEGEVTSIDYNAPVQRSNSDYIFPLDYVHTGELNLDTQKVVKPNTWPKTTGHWDISVTKQTVQSSWSDMVGGMKQGQGTDHITESTRCNTASIDGQLCRSGLDTDYITPFDGVDIYTDGQLCRGGLDTDYITPVDGVDIYTDGQLCRSGLDTDYITPVDGVDIYTDGQLCRSGLDTDYITPVDGVDIYTDGQLCRGGLDTTTSHQLMVLIYTDGQLW
ncbi:hypothetical protein Btru_012859 [Bulinus truncatus]|nr:hypothetical protein Btru_012859 [Bulinus truncatus]